MTGEAGFLQPGFPGSFQARGGCIHNPSITKRSGLPTWAPRVPQGTPLVWIERTLEREAEAERARKLREYLVGRGEELRTGTGGLAQSNAAELGPRFHFAGKRKVSGGSRALVGATRTAAFVSEHAAARMRGTPYAEMVKTAPTRREGDPFGPGVGLPTPRVHRRPERRGRFMSRKALPPINGRFVMAHRLRDGKTVR